MQRRPVYYLQTEGEYLKRIKQIETRQVYSYRFELHSENKKKRIYVIQMFICVCQYLNTYLFIYVHSILEELSRF
jgi:hypothetical protein